VQLGVADAVAVAVGVAVGVGDPHDATEAVNFWPVATGGACPVVSHAYWVNSVVFSWTPIEVIRPVVVVPLIRP
jgi:hypothetical protein